MLVANNVDEYQLTANNNIPTGELQPETDVTQSLISARNSSSNEAYDKLFTITLLSIKLYKVLQTQIFLLPHSFNSGIPSMNTMF